VQVPPLEGVLLRLHHGILWQKRRDAHPTQHRALRCQQHHSASKGKSRFDVVAQLDVGIYRWAAAFSLCFVTRVGPFR